MMAAMDKENKEQILKVRVTKEEKEAFQKACKAKAINPSELIRQFMESTVRKAKEPRRD